MATKATNERCWCCLSFGLWIQAKVFCHVVRLWRLSSFTVTTPACLWCGSMLVLSCRWRDLNCCRLPLCVAWSYQSRWFAASICSLERPSLCWLKRCVCHRRLVLLSFIGWLVVDIMKMTQRWSVEHSHENWDLTSRACLEAIWAGLHVLYVWELTLSSNMCVELVCDIYQRLIWKWNTVIMRWV